MLRLDREGGFVGLLPSNVRLSMENSRLREHLSGPEGPHGSEGELASYRESAEQLQERNKRLLQEVSELKQEAHPPGMPSSCLLCVPLVEP